MKVIYSIGAKFASPGIGYTAYQAVKEIGKANYLYRLLCADYSESEIKKELVMRYPLPFLIEKIPYYIKNLLMPEFSVSKFKDNAYDNWAASKIDICDIFHGWNNQCLESIKKAKNLGAKIFLERASTHITVQNELLNREYKKFNVPYSPIDKNVIQKSIREYELADKIVVPSVFAYESFIEHKVPKEKLVLTRFGVDSKHYTPKEKKDDVFRLIFVGQVSYRKGVHYLLNAYDSLKLENSELVIIGRVLPEALGLVEYYKKKKGIIFKEFAQDLAKEYQNSSLFVFPSIEEGSALVTYEAMACGVPVITTKNAGSIVKNGRDGFIVSAGNVKALKDKIAYFYNNEKEMKKVGMAARNTAVKHPWSAYGRDIIKAYKEAMK